MPEETRIPSMTPRPSPELMRKWMRTQAAERRRWGRLDRKIKEAQERSREWYQQKDQELKAMEARK